MCDMDSITTIAFLNMIGWQEIVLIVLVVLLLFGGKKLPELARGLGRGLRVFKKEVSGVKDTVSKALDEEVPDEDDRKEQAAKPQEKANDETA